MSANSYNTARIVLYNVLYSKGLNCRCGACRPRRLRAGPAKRNRSSTCRNKSLGRRIASQAESRPRADRCGACRTRRRRPLDGGSSLSQWSARQALGSDAAPAGSLVQLSCPALQEIAPPLPDPRAGAPHHLNAWTGK